MPVPKKKRTTSTPDPSTSEPSPPVLPEQQAFHQHLRALAQRAVRTVLELVMREELDAFIGAEWGECGPKRRGYRNGTYTRESSDSDGPTRRSEAYPEIGRATSTVRFLTATAAMNRILRDPSHPDVCSGNEHA